MNAPRKVLLSSLSLTMALTLAACGVKKEEQPTPAATAASTSQATKAPEAKKPVKLRIKWWGSQARHDATLKALDLYTKKNPHITFEPEYSSIDGYQDKIATMAAAKNLPDIVQLDAGWLKDWESSNRLADISTGINTKDIDAALVNSGKYKDKLYAVPLGNNAYGMVYNKSLVDKLGITIPTNWTWDDFFRLAKESKSKLGKDQYFTSDFTNDFVFYNAFQTSKGKGWPKQDGKFNYDKQTFIEYMTKFKELRDGGFVPPADVTVSDKLGDAKLDLLGQDKILVRSSHAAEVAGSETLKPGQIQITTAPRDKQASGFLKASMYFSVSPDSVSVEESKKFIDWFVNDQEVADLLGTARGVPVSKSILSYLQPKFTPVDKLGIDMISKVAPDAQTYDPGPGKANGWDKFDLSYESIRQQVMFNKLTPEKAWDELEKIGKEIK